MGFFNLLVTVTGHASAADISTTTRPFFACPCACHLHQGLVDNQKQSSVRCPDWTPRDRSSTKKGHRSTPKSWFQTVYPLNRYQDLTPQTLPPNHPQG